MCSEADLFLAAAPNLNLTPDEKRLYGQLFQRADSDSVGVVTGEVAVKFFEKTRLEPRVLGEVCISILRLQPSPTTMSTRFIILTFSVPLDMADCG